jgi:hypothetical protein
VESTIIRIVHTSALLVGPNSPVADRVTEGFEQAAVRVLRVGHAAAACERLPVAMPQVVVVLGALHAEEREALADRATAVGALIMYVDPELDPETLEELVQRAASAAIERKIQRDDAARADRASTPPEAEDDVDSKW